MRHTTRPRLGHLLAATVTTLAVTAAAALAVTLVVAPPHVDAARAEALPSRAMNHAAAPQVIVAPKPEVVSAIAPPSPATTLFVPPLLVPTIEGSTKVFHLTAQAGTITRFGAQLATAGFNGGYLAPTIRVSRGDRVRVDIDNELDEPTTVHWHGLHVAAVDDGGPYGLIAPGASRHATFEVMQQAATLWYHPHVMGQTAPQVGRGMAGLLEITDGAAAERVLPHRYGVDDLPLLLQGAPLPVGGAADTARRPLLVNGTPNAVHRSAAGRLRLRLVNGTAGALLGVRFVGAVRVRQVGSDGGLLPRAVATSRVVLGPSERAEFVVDVRRGSRVQVQSTVLASQGAGAAGEQSAYLQGRARAADTGTLLTLVNTARVLGRQPTLPARLNAAPALDLSAAVQRDMVLGPTIQINGQLMEHVDGGAGMPGTLRIPLGQTEVWTITNTSPFTHVFHVHDIEFQVLDRNGAAPAPSEAGWKDSIHVPPGGEVRIAMQFTDFASLEHPYMFHCHVLRHEDAGMMGQFVVVPNG
ncbi:MAG: multicopper oxidase domain-containing protein [Thermoleophilia bacterium]|nr:multicopper oxidase domain-containing protein [Thermoleophilia bacterium]